MPICKVEPEWKGKYAPVSGLSPFSPCGSRRTGVNEKATGILTPSGYEPERLHPDGYSETLGSKSPVGKHMSLV